MYSMADVVREVDAEREALPDGALFKWLSDESVDGYRRLSFLPSMLYYLMGFKDVLATLSRDDSQTDLEHHINAYCLEDADHWRWYLTDLDKLGFDLTCWGETISDWCNEVWSPETEINRQTIFHLIRFAMSNRDPLYQLALILVFEAACRGSAMRGSSALTERWRSDWPALVADACFSASRRCARPT